jgi:tRNA(fMet)-specific endonuclease VapC
MTYLLDTDQVIDYLKGRQEIRSLISALGGDGLAISLITYGEIYDGIYGDPNPQLAEVGFTSLLTGVTVLPLTRQIMRRFARIRGNLRRTGQRLEDIDLLIAATALDHNLILITRNIQHFQRIPRLSLYT